NPDVMPQITIAAWAKLTSNNSELTHAIISNDNYGWDRAILDWYDYGWGLVNGNGLTGYYPEIANKWVFLVGVYNNENGLVKFYADNNIYESRGYLGNGSIETYIGCSAHNSAFFEGVIDEIRIYNRVLSEKEIGELYQQFLGGDGQMEDFSFAHLTDIHLGLSWIPGHSWSEELSYPRFTDALFEIGWELGEKPDFILVSGDTVERAKTRWFKDYESIIQTFSAQSGIPVYMVPGNHDRYRRATGSYFCQIYGVDNCDDGLFKYQKFLSLPESNFGENGIDYEFTHKGVRFIGMDSGSDFMPDYELTDLIGDIGIEGSGLSDNQISALENLDSASPKIVFMHHPVFTGAIDDYENGSLEDASFADNRGSFLDWASASGLQLVLAGHTHQTGVFDIESTEYTDLSAAFSRPLFIETQSATHDGNLGHGYRLVSIQDGFANPKEAAETGDYSKVISRLSTNKLFNLRVYDPLILDHYITLNDTKGLSVPFFIASSSKKVLVYNPSAASSKFQVIGNDLPAKGKYDLEIRKEDQEIASEAGKDFGFKSDFQNKSFINYHLNNKLARFDLEDFTVKPDNSHEIILDWNKIAGDQITDGIAIKNIFGATVREAGFAPMKDSIIARLASPAELRVINSSGSTTGLMDEQILENIDYSMFDSENRRILLYFPEGYNNEEFIFRVKGLLAEDFKYPGNDYTLQIDLKIDNEIAKQVKIHDLPINASTTHQFRVDWERLDEFSGVIMEIDKDGDGNFEQKVYLGETVSAYNFYNIRKQIISSLKAAKTGRIKIDYKIDTIISLLEKSLKDKLWIDNFHLDSVYGRKVFQLDKRIAGMIKLYSRLDNLFSNKRFVPKFVKNRFDLPKDVFNAFNSAIRDIQYFDIILAQTAIKEAGFPQNDKSFARSYARLEKAKNYFENNYILCIQNSFNAWKILNKK
ncbi:MAG: metallophosphoesterase, partial [Patescibacteria group bacterium]|nr:metallophosphoesterase [Patescibacteria group bacterium]